MKNNGLLERFEDYLMTKPVRESFSLTKEGGLSFHWANWQQTCELWQKRTDVNDSFQKRREMFCKELENYKSLPAWIKSKSGLKRINVYELHDSFLRQGHLSHNEEVLISLHSESGPYTSMTSMRWLDTDLYKYFVYNQIFNSKINLRKFRVNANIPVLSRVDQMMMNRSLMYFHQFTEEGIILRIPGKPLLDKVMNSKFIEFYFDFTSFKEVMNVSFGEAIAHLDRGLFNIFENNAEKNKFLLSTSTVERYQNRDNLKKMGGNQYYIFARFSDFNSDENLEEIFKNFTGKAESFFKEGLKKIA